MPRRGKGRSTEGAEGRGVMPRFSSHSYFPISRVPQWRCKLGAALKGLVRRAAPPAAIIIPPARRAGSFGRPSGRDRRAVMHNRGVKSPVIKTSAICRNNAAECRLASASASAAAGDEQALSRIRHPSIRPRPPVGLHVNQADFLP